MKELVETPILFLIFNRPDTTRLVFNKIREVKPRFLYIAADGPRQTVPGEDKKCRAAQDIISQVDWDCKVHTLFRNDNLGCKKAVSSAITWFFSHVEAGIILEDDCLPDRSFFFFCEELLERYKDDEQTMMISGDNFHILSGEHTHSYYFSRYCHIWGWATWRRAWELYDADLKQWPNIKENNVLDRIFPNKNLVDYWSSIFEMVHQNKIDTWDYQWFFSCLANNGLSIVPHVNLISNIGFNSSATHTKEANKYANMAHSSIESPMNHPRSVERDLKLDSLEEKDMYISPERESILNKLQSKLKSALLRLF
ncbi:MAG: glycosyltransferase family 2 protein [Nitrospirota bacterium]